MQCYEQPRPARCHRDADRAAGHAQHGGLGEKLAREAQASCAERDAYCELLLASDGTREQHADDVRARDEEEQHHGCPKHVERATHAAHDAVVQRDDRGVRHPCVGAMLDLEPPRDRAEVLARLRHRYAGREPGHGLPVVRRTLRVERHELARSPEAAPGRKIETGRQYADNRECGRSPIVSDRDAKSAAPPR